ncbi:MAG: hypothetical protein U0903_22685 [Planctomycetales bacterium]
MKPPGSKSRETAWSHWAEIFVTWATRGIFSLTAQLRWVAGAEKGYLAPRFSPDGRQGGDIGGYFPGEIPGPT